MVRFMFYVSMFNHFLTVPYRTFMDMRVMWGRDVGGGGVVYV
jgi:hypothetical protein